MQQLTIDLTNGAAGWAAEFLRLVGFAECTTAIAQAVLDNLCAAEGMPAVVRKQRAVDALASLPKPATVEQVAVSDHTERGYALSVMLTGKRGMGIHPVFDGEGKLASYVVTLLRVS